MPSDSTMPDRRDSRWVPKASRIEPATICSFFWSWVDMAVSITKKLISSAIRSAKVTNQPCPPLSAALLARHRVPLPIRPLRPFRGGGGRAGRPAASRARRSGSWQSRICRMPSMMRRAGDVLLLELQVQFVGDRQADQVADERAVERRQQRDGHERTELRGVLHVGEHLHHADQRADHAPGRSGVADGPVDLLALVEAQEEVVAVALHRVA